MTYQQIDGTFVVFVKYPQTRYQQNGDMALTDTFVKNIKPNGAAVGER